MIKIALIGHNTRNDNLGVGALTVSNIEIIRNIARRLEVTIEITVLIGNETRKSCVNGDDVVERFVRPLRKPWGFFSAIRSSDLVIDISGGDSFADIYGHRRTFLILLQKYLVHLAGRPLVMAPQTIGPFRSRVWRILAAQTIKRCIIVATRDDKSTAFLSEIGVRRNVVEASDVALRLPYTKLATRPEGPPRVGLNVSGLLMNGGYNGKNMFGLKADYPVLIRRIVQDFLSHEKGCELHLIGHVIPLQRGGVEDDYQACLDLTSEFPQAIVAPAFESPAEAKSYIAGLDFFMGARMHACVAAFSSGVPFVAMAYSRKFAGLFGSLGYNHTADVTTDGAEDILNQTLYAYETRLDLEREVQIALQKGLHKLGAYEVALEECLACYQIAT